LIFPETLQNAKGEQSGAEAHWIIEQIYAPAKRSPKLPSNTTFLCSFSFAAGFFHDGKPVLPLRMFAAKLQTLLAEGQNGRKASAQLLRSLSGVT
jgi:hypothetical protein